MGTLGELTSILRFVLPGLLAAWVFYGLTTYEKPGEFERIAQALVFTILLELTARSIVAAGVLVGRVSVPLLPVVEPTSVATLLAIPFGILLAWLANNDVVHARLRDYGVTTKSGRPDQWDSAFRRRSGYAILDLLDGRRIYGWPIEWPDRPGGGHFLLREHQWVGPEGDLISNPKAGAILIPGKEVGIVQFLEDVARA
jgi:hypothetical protein